jgi:3'-5' exoribonuclease
VKKKNLYISGMKSGEKVSTSFLVSEKNLAYSQKGAPYLNLRLKDKTGELDGKVWENATELDGFFKKGDIVHIVGRILSYKNNLQVSVLEVKKTEDEEIDPADYFPTSSRDADDMFAELLVIVEQIQTPCLKDLLLAFFRDEQIVKLFKKAPAAKGFHHVYLGGLLEHTLSVIRLLDLAARHYTGVNRDLLLTGGILHDIGKIYEFQYDRLIDYSDAGRLVGHIVMGVEMLDARIAKIEGFPENLAMELRHLILSHHGTLEYGSPKRPKTLEAMIVHYIDDLDAKVNAFQTFTSGIPDSESNWTPFHRLFERYIYKGSSSSDEGGSQNR